MRNCVVEIDKWANRPNFVARLKEYRIKHGRTFEQAAYDLGAASATVRHWMNAKNISVPSLFAMQRAAALFRCSVMEFVDDPCPQRRPHSTDILRLASRIPKGSPVADVLYELLSMDADLQQGFASLLVRYFKLGRSRNFVRWPSTQFRLSSYLLRNNKIRKS